MTNCTLKEGEPHPSAHSAYHYVIRNLSPTIRESLASCAIEGNRLAEICLGTIHRLDKNLPVSDRYILGLAWFIRDGGRE